MDSEANVRKDQPGQIYSGVLDPMPRGYRCIVLAVVGWLILQPQHGAVAQQAAYNQQAAERNMQRGEIGKLPRTEEYRPNCQRPQNREESDLCAQWGAVAAARRANDLAADANRATRDANSISAQTLLWTRLGFFAVVLTLFATAWAAWAAARAASMAERSVGLFKETEAGYLVPGVEIDSAGMSWAAHAINRGKTGVTIVHADINIYDAPPDFAIPILEHNFPAHNLIAPEKAYKFGAFQFPTQSRIVFVAGGIIYKTLGWETRLCRISARVDRSTGITEVCADIDFSNWERLRSDLSSKKWWQKPKRKFDVEHYQRRKN